MSYSPYVKSILINKYIGKEVYKSVHPETKYILIKDAMKQFNGDMVKKFGSFYNYFRYWCKKNGFNTPGEYHKHCVIIRGFESDNKYRESNAKKRGFKSRGNLFLKYAKDKGFKKVHEHTLLH